MIWDTQSTDAIEYGNIIHELMANIITENDTQTNINRIFNQGIISIEQFTPIKELIEKIVHHEELKKYFELDKTVFTERELITKDKQILIPDRLVFNRKNEVSIIDYKTGRRDEKHHDQIENYANVMNSMNYKVWCIFTIK